jgi:hypothetical protein
MLISSRGIKIYHILIAILVFSLIYIAFQLLILNKLNILNKVILQQTLKNNDDNSITYLRKKLEINEDLLIKIDNYTFHKKIFQSNILEINKDKKSLLIKNSNEYFSKKNNNNLNQTLDSFFHYHVVKYIKENNKNNNDIKLNFDLKGVNRNDYKFYEPDENGQFTCIKSKVSFKCIGTDVL